MVASGERVGCVCVGKKLRTFCCHNIIVRLRSDRRRLHINGPVARHGIERIVLVGIEVELFARGCSIPVVITAVVLTYGRKKK